MDASGSEPRKSESGDTTGSRRVTAMDRSEAAVEQGRISRVRRQRISNTVAPIGTLVALILVWEFGATLLETPTYLLPRPTDIWTAFFANWEVLIEHAQVTTFEVIVGYLLSVVGGVALGLAIFLSPALGRSIYPLLVSTQAIPKTAIAPLFVVWFGFGLLPKVLIAFLIAFFPILISTVVGLMSIDAGKLRLAKSIGLGRWGTFVKIRLPQAAPSIFGGLKVGITLCVVGAVVGEFVGASSGLGYLLLVASGNLNSPLLFAALFLLTVIGVGGFLLVSLAERLLIPWHKGAGDQVAGM